MQESDPTASPAPPAWSPLDATEARILGCLIEKEATTPEAYPLTVNALVTACNQKTSREPLMHLQPGAVEHALRGMQDKDLVKLAPASQRALRYEHQFDAVYGVTPRQRAVLCLLLLRGPQTPGELLARTQRIIEFPGPAEVRDTLARLIERDTPMVIDLGRSSGQRENRYMHLLSGSVDASSFVPSAPATTPRGRDELELRVEKLETDLADLRGALDQVQSQLAQHIP